jgi:hypothetical protein
MSSGIILICVSEKFTNFTQISSGFIDG